MKPITTILFLALLVGFTACKKNVTTHIQAVNIVSGSGDDYAGLPFSIVEQRVGVFESHYKNVYNGTLDSHGEAIVELKMNKNRIYQLGIEEPDNNCYSNDLFFHLNNDQNNEVNIEFAPCGYINIPRVNVNCENEFDKFRYKYYYSSDQNIYIYTGYIDSDFNWRDDKYLEGCIDYSNAQSYNARPIGNYTIEWMVERTSGTTTGIDYFTVNENDTTTYVLEY